MNRFLNLFLAVILAFSGTCLSVNAANLTDDPILETVIDRQDNGEEVVEFWVCTEGMLFWRTSYAVIRLSNDEGVWEYTSPSMKIAQFTKPTFREIAMYDPNLQSVYPLLKKVVVNMWAEALYEDMVSENSQTYTYDAWQNIVKDWMNSTRNDLLKDMSKEIIGIVPSFNELASTFYENSVDVYEEIQAGFTAFDIESTFEDLPWIRMMVESVFSTIIVWNYSLDEATSSVSGDEAELTKMFDNDKAVLHDTIRTLLTEQGTKIQ